MRLRAFLFVLLTDLLAIAYIFGGKLVHAQTATVTLTASHLTNLSGSPVTGKFCITPTNNSGSPIGFEFGSGGQGTQNQVCASVTAGVLSMAVPDTAVTNPANVCLMAQLYPSLSPVNSQPLRTWVCLQPASSGQTSWCTTNGGATTCNLDNHAPTATAGTVMTTGPQGATGPAGPSISGVSSDGSNGLDVAGSVTSSGNIVGPIRDSGGQWLNALTKGAGTGLSDNSGAFATAITALPDAGTLFVPNGNNNPYLFTSAINLQNLTNIAFWGPGVANAVMDIQPATLSYGGTGSGAFMQLQGSEGHSERGIDANYSSSSFTGPLYLLGDAVNTNNSAFGTFSFGRYGGKNGVTSASAIFDVDSANSGTGDSYGNLWERDIFLNGTTAILGPNNQNGTTFLDGEETVRDSWCEKGFSGPCFAPSGEGPWNFEDDGIQNPATGTVPDGIAPTSSGVQILNVSGLWSGDGSTNTGAGVDMSNVTSSSYPAQDVNVSGSLLSGYLTGIKLSPQTFHFVAFGNEITSVTNCFDLNGSSAALWLLGNTCQGTNIFAGNPTITNFGIIPTFGSFSYAYLVGQNSTSLGNGVWEGISGAYPTSSSNPGWFTYNSVNLPPIGISLDVDSDAGSNQAWWINNPYGIKLLVGGNSTTQPYGVFFDNNGVFHFRNQSNTDKATINAASGGAVFNGLTAFNLVLSSSLSVGGNTILPPTATLPYVGSNDGNAIASGTMTGTTTTAAHNFTTNFAATPVCTANPESNVGSWYVSAISTVSITVTYATSGASTWMVICNGNGGQW